MRGGAAPALVQIPTTVATGAEVSATASLRDARGDKRLLHAPVLLAQAAVLDPALTRGLDRRALGGGGLECQRRADRGGRAEDATRAALADPDDDGPRGELALVSAASQLGWTTLGRTVDGYALWSVQNALSSACGAPKSAAQPALVPAWAQAVARGARVFGDAARLARIGAAALGCEPDPHAAAAALAALVGEWALPGSMGAAGIEVDAATLVAVCLRQWPELFGGADAEAALRDLHAAAAGARAVSVRAARPSAALSAAPRRG